MDKMKVACHSVDVARHWTKDEMNYEQDVTTAVFNDFFSRNDAKVLN